MEEYVAKCLTPLYRVKWLMTTLTDECYNDLVKKWDDKMEEYVIDCLKPLYRLRWIKDVLTEENYNELDRVIRLYVAINDKRLWI